MRCVIGLGNPGKKYSMSRHNIGFLIIDELAEKLSLNFLPSKFDFYYSEGTLESSDFFLVKPTTYMNLSGNAVQDFLSGHSIPIENILVVYDDINLPFGKIRLRKSGSDGGHNGIKSIIYNLQSDEFPRLRFGIGRNFSEGELSEYVLSTFENNEIQLLKEQIPFAMDLIQEFIVGGFRYMADSFSRNSKLINDKDDSGLDEML